MWSRRVVLLGALGLSTGAWAKDKKKKKDAKKSVSLGLLSGTVFHPGGLSFPGVQITAYDKTTSKTVQKGVTDRRGEYAIRVPASVEGIEYRLEADAKDFAPLEREVYAYDSQRTTANFRFKAETESTQP